ncbi:MAG TPA: DUF5597 domain-containing protein [Phycisphaerae bacterium]|nr:DUF5597 domain-containing protein [Phycisphaerae bacterium]
MKRLFGWPMVAAVMLTGCTAQEMQREMPHLEKRDGMTKLIVDGRPFICVAGELANSTSSDRQATEAAIPRLAKANLNTILSVVSWDLVEPREGVFDFSIVDYQIAAARASKVRLILLWMGSWKNGLSHYPPEWVKRDQERFPRVVNAEGHTLEILSTLSAANREADAKAFAAVMRHIREVDREHTVIGMQVENEAGLLGSTRDFSPAANAAYAGQVPGELMDYLARNRAHLMPEFKKVWEAAGGKTRGTWEEVFGRNVARPDAPVPNSPMRGPRAAGMELYNHTDEIFMAWNYSRYIGAVAAAGKREYAIPMYANTWIVQTMDLGPGDYPSGGPQVFVHDVWRCGAPAVDILAPDIYLPQFGEILQSFSRNGNPAFVPETRQDGSNAWNAFTQWNALCYSPFGIDNLNPESAFARAYGFLNSVSGAIAEAQGRANAIKLITLEAGQNPGRVEMDDYVFDFTPAPGRRGPGRGPATTSAPATTPDGAGGGTGGLPFLNAPYLVILHTGEDEFYFATNGSFPFRTSAKVAGKPITAPATIDRGYFQNGHWITTRRLNGDDLMGLGYDLSGAAANNQPGTQIPLGRGRGAAAAEGGATTILRVRFYHYK